MDYANAVATFCGPRPAGTPLPEVVRAGSPARRLRDACEPLAMHAVWNRRTNERLAALGLDFLTGYVGGRAASLGEPSPPVVAAAFAWFEPNLLAGWYEAARSTAPRERLLAMRAAVDGLEARGWLRDGALTDAGRAARADIEDRTDASEQAIVAELGGRLDEVCSRLDGWSERCITAGAFPADILKRAAG